MPEFTTQDLRIPSFGARAAVYQRHNFQPPNVEEDKLSRVIIFGGIKQDATWIYTLVDNSWFPLPWKSTQPVSRIGHTLTRFCGSFVLLFGGFSIDSVREFFTSYDYNYFPKPADPWLFDGVNEMWRKLEIPSGHEHPRSRGFHSAIALRNRESPCKCKESVFIYGGDAFHGIAFDDLWEFSCYRQTNQSLSFKWSMVDKKPRSHWPFPSKGHLAMHVDMAKTAMMIWPIEHFTLSRTRERYWVFNSTSRSWNSFVMASDIQRHENAMYHTAVFDEALEQIVELVSHRAYAFSLSDKRWQATSPSLLESGVKKGMTLAAAYADSLILVFASSHPEEFPDRPRVWMLNLRTLPLAWKLNSYKPEPPGFPSGHLSAGTWIIVGNAIILSPRRAPQLETFIMGIWAAFCGKASPKRSWDEVHQFQRQINLGILMAVGATQLLGPAPAPVLQRKDIHHHIQVVWQLDLLTLTWFPYSTSHSTTEASGFYSFSTNWADKAFVTFGSSLTNDRTLDSIPVLRSDVWVYFTDNRRWLNVTILSKSMPGFRLFPSITFCGENSFVLFGGAFLHFTQETFEDFVAYDKCKGCECEYPKVFSKNFTAIFDMVSPKNDLWLLKLTDCDSSSCFDSGLAGEWSELRPRTTVLPPVRVGHSSQFIDRKLFVFGGVNVGIYGEVRRVVHQNDIWYFDTKKDNWFVASEMGMDQFGFYLFMFRQGVLQTCAYGRRVLMAIPSYSVHNEHPNVTFRLVSYITNTRQWVDHKIDFSFEGEALFCWRDRVVTIARQSEEVIIDSNLRQAVVKVYLSELQPGCPAGQHSLNWSALLCEPCSKGYFSSPGATLCTPCPGGLSTEGQGASSISNCSCDPSYCKHGRCSIVKSQTQLAAECMCHFGYTGERCEFPILFIAVFSGVAALMVVIILSVFVRKLVNYRKAKRTKEFELEEMDRAWTVTPSEVTLLHVVDTASPGSYGDVYEARYRDMIVAVKKLKVVMRNPRIEREFKREIQLMKSIRHPNIVLFIGAGRDDDSGCLFLVLEFMRGGSLTVVLRDWEVQLGSSQQTRFCLDAARGLEFLHNLSPPRIHRDIKSNNLLLSERWVVKVADFGCARLVKGEGLEQRVAEREIRTPFSSSFSDAHTPLLQAERDLSSNVGAVLWRAPEIFLGESYGTKVDVYRYVTIID